MRWKFLRNLLVFGCGFACGVAFVNMARSKNVCSSEESEDDFDEDSIFDDFDEDEWEDDTEEDDDWDIDSDDSDEEKPVEDQTSKE